LNRIALFSASVESFPAYLVDPYACSIARFDRIERVFVVASIGRHVPISTMSKRCSARSRRPGRLGGAALCGNIALTLRELERLGAEAR